MKAIKNSLDNHFKGFSIKKDCIADKQDLQTILKNLRNMFGVTSQQVTSLTKEMDDTQLDLDTKADRKDIVRIDKKCTMMPTS